MAALSDQNARIGEPQRLRLYLSGEHACGYLPERNARNAYVDPDVALDPALYGALLEQGYRRSGAHVYRPYCLMCRACMPARVPVLQFSPSRAQRRCLARNHDVDVRVVERLTDEHHALYARYLSARHPGGGMDGADRAAFHGFLECDWGVAQVAHFLELRSGARLLAVAVVDRVPRALSAVYTFFDPQEAARGLGTLAILKQIEAARAQQLTHLYLGYWVAGSAKMDYKKNFRPLERLSPEGWRCAL